MENLTILKQEQERRLKKMSVEIEKRERTLQKMEEQIRFSSDYLGSLEKNIEKLGENVHLIEASRDGGSELSALQSQIQDLHQKVTEAQEIYKEQERRNLDVISDLRSQLRSSKMQAHILETRIRGFETDNRDLKVETKELTQFVDEYKFQKENFESLITELRGINTELSKRLEKLTTEKSDLGKEKSDLEKENKDLGIEIEGLNKFVGLGKLGDIDLSDEEIANLDLSEWKAEDAIESAYPWNEAIAKFDEIDDLIDDLATDNLAEKKKTLPKRKLRELELLHASLRRAKDKLEDYFKTPPVARKDLDSEISAIQDAMVDVLKGAGVKRVEIGKYIYSLRKTPVYYKIVSEKTAISSLKKKKLGKFIKAIEVLDMAKLKSFLKARKLTIPGLKKITTDISIYIYERHEEEARLIYILGPEGFEEISEETSEAEKLQMEKFQAEKSSSSESSSSNSSSSSSSESSSSSSSESSSSESSSSESSSSKTFIAKGEDEDLEDKGLEWHLIPEDQRLEDIRETIEDREPRKSDPFPEPVVKFIKELATKDMSDTLIDKALIKEIKDGKLPSWKMYLSDSERYDFTENNFDSFQISPGFLPETPNFFRTPVIPENVDIKFERLKFGMAGDCTSYFDTSGKAFSHEIRLDSRLKKSPIFTRYIFNHELRHVSDAEAGYPVKRLKDGSWKFKTKIFHFEPKTKIYTIKAAKFTKKHLYDQVIKPLAKKIMSKLKISSLSKFIKFLTGPLRIVPGVLPILEAVDYGLLWKDLDNLEKDIEAGSANEQQKRIWEWRQQEGKASEKEWDETDFDQIFDGEFDRFVDLNTFDDSELSGLYLTSPHPEFIWTGAKTAIVKSKKFQEHIDKPLYLISNDDCWGIIKLSEPKEINQKEFNERYEEHLVENSERVEWWNGKLPLYLYKVEVIEKFDPVKKVKIPRGVQIFVLPQNINFK